jgi:hypothetical protein
LVIITVKSICGILKGYGLDYLQDIVAENIRYYHHAFRVVESKGTLVYTKAKNAQMNLKFEHCIQRAIERIITQTPTQTVSIRTHKVWNILEQYYPNHLKSLNAKVLGGCVRTYLSQNYPNMIVMKTTKGKKYIIKKYP